MHIFVLLAVFVVSLGWSIWAMTYRWLVPDWQQSKFMRNFGLGALFLGGILAGNFGSQLVKAILALT